MTAAEEPRPRHPDRGRAHETRRGGQACESCRAGKRKCDGVRPVCGTCHKRGPRVTCVYEKNGGRKARTSKQIELLEKRIAELEESRSKAPETQLDDDGLLPPPRSLLPSHPAAGSPLEHESLQEYPHGRAPTRQSYNALLSPRLSEVMGCRELASTQDTPSVRTSFRHNRVGSASESHFDDEPKIVGGRVDGMGTVASDVTDLNELCADQIGYFGTSSTVNFVNQVHRILLETNNTVLPSPIGVGHGRSDERLERRLENVHTPEYRIPVQRRVEEYVVPPRKEADAMLELFWLRMHPLYPILDRERFEKEYADIWASSDSASSAAGYSSGPVFAGSPDYRHQYSSRWGPGHYIPKSRRFHMLLNMMFALGCRCDTSETVARQAQRGEMFWERCKDLLELDFDIFNQPCIEFIQASLLMCIYLQSTTELTGACWNLVGVAIRFAQALGLHCTFNANARKSHPDCKVSSREASYSSLRWRIWAGLVLMDRSLATAYGRPVMISSRAARVHLPPELARKSSSSSSSDSLTFMTHLLKLQEILTNIVTHFNDDDNEAADDNGDAMPQYGYGIEGANMLFKAPSLIRQIEAGDFQDLVNFEANLLTWERELPASLRLPPTMELISDSLAVSSVERRSIVLRARYLYGQVLFYRPLLLHQMARSKYRRHDLRDSKTILSTLGNAMLDRGPTMCINAAVELILLMEWVHRTRSDALPEPWYTIFYLYTCGMVLLVHRHCASDHLEETNHGWTKCLDVLTSYMTTSRTALRCLKLLQLSDGSFRSRPPFSQAPPAAAAPEAVQNNPHDIAGPHHAWSAGGNPDLPAAAMGVGVGTDDGIPNYQDVPHDLGDDFTVSWMDDQIDLAWLSTVPFELGSADDMGDMMFF